MGSLATAQDNLENTAYFVAFSDINPLRNDARNSYSWQGDTDPLYGSGFLQAAAFNFTNPLNFYVSGKFEASKLPYGQVRIGNTDIQNADII